MMSELTGSLIKHDYVLLSCNIKIKCRHSTWPKLTCQAWEESMILAWRYCTCFLAWSILKTFQIMNVSEPQTSTKNCTVLLVNMACLPSKHKSKHASYLEKSCKQGLQNLTSDEIRWHLTPTKTNRAVPLHTVHCHAT